MIRSAQPGLQLPIYTNITTCGDRGGCYNLLSKTYNLSSLKFLNI